MTQYITWQHYWYYSTRYIAVRSWSAGHPSVHYRHYLIHHVTALLIQLNTLHCSPTYSARHPSVHYWHDSITWLHYWDYSTRCAAVCSWSARHPPVHYWHDSIRHVTALLTLHKHVVLQSTVEVQDTPQSGPMDGQCAHASVVFRCTYIRSCTHTHLHVYLNIQRYWVSAIYICSDDIEIYIADTQYSAWNMQSCIGCQQYLHICSVLLLFNVIYVYIYIYIWCIECQQYLNICNVLLVNVECSNCQCCIQ